MNILFKYLPIERITYLDDELLRFTQPADLNDPFECFPKQINKEILLKFLKEKLRPDLFRKEGVKISRNFYDNLPKIIDGYLPNAYDETNKLVGILSLSKNWNNTLMWSHYSTSHRGFCIGFNKNHSYFDDYIDTLNDKSQHTKDVCYSYDRVELDLQTPFKKPGFEIFTTKSKDWIYEDEVRIISSLNRSDAVIESNPYNIHLFKVPHKAISEIVVGAKTEIIVKEKLKLFSRQFNIPIYQAEISKSSFNMERALLE
jgi:hypothetical protein